MQKSHWPAVAALIVAGIALARVMPPPPPVIYAPRLKAVADIDAKLKASVAELGAPDFATREGAQKALDAVPPQRRADLAALLNQARDAEIAARLKARIT